MGHRASKQRTPTAPQTGQVTENSRRRRSSAKVNGKPVLNNATYGRGRAVQPRGVSLHAGSRDEDTDTEWIHGLTVAATTTPKTPYNITPPQRTQASSLRTDVLRREVLLCRNDSLSQSLHKEITYPAVNVSRKSNSSSESTPPPAEGAATAPGGVAKFSRTSKHVKKRIHKATLAPDRLYPLAYQGSDLGTTKNTEPKAQKNKKRARPCEISACEENSNANGNGAATQLMPYNDISATVARGWYSCFKNNNYLFVRNWKSNDCSNGKTDEESPWYRNYDILNSKLHISLEPKQETSNDNTESKENRPPSGTVEVTHTAVDVPAPSPEDNGSSSSNSDNAPPEEADKANSGQNEGDEKPNDCDKQKQEEQQEQHHQKKGPASWLRKLRVPRKTPRKPSQRNDSENGANLEDAGTPSCFRVTSVDNITATDEGPHSSTPRDGANNYLAFSATSHRSLPYRSRHNGLTPKRHLEKTCVRRRLPYTPLRPYKERRNLDLMSLSPQMWRPPSRRILAMSWHEMNAKGKRAKFVDGTIILRRSTSCSSGRRKNASLPAILMDEKFESPRRRSSEKLFKRDFASAPAVLDEMRSEYTPSVADIEREENLSFAGYEKLVRRPRDDTEDSKMADDEEEEEEQGEGNGPVVSWLKEVRCTTDGECLNALQSKLVSNKDKSLTATIAVGTAQEAVEKIWDSGICVLEHLKLSRKILEQNDPASSPGARWVSFRMQLDRFCHALREFLVRKRAISSSGPPEEASKVAEDFGELMNSVSGDESVIGQMSWKEKTLSEIDSLEKSFRLHLERMVRPHIKVIIEQVNEASNIICMKRSLYAVILLGKQFGSSLCDILAQADVMRALLTVCLEKKWRPLQVCALRAVTVVCSSGEAVRRLLECDGIECVAEMLEPDADALNPEEESKRRSEAAGIIAQCTAPWVESSFYVLQHQKLRKCGDSLVRCLTDLADRASSSEVFLLATAALANLSLCTEAASHWIPKHNTLEVLTNACRNKKDVAGSLFAMDQVSTVLANCASHSSACRLMAGSSALLVSLLCFLQVRPCLGHTPSETASCERLQQKAAITMARMCSSEPEVANGIAEMQGLQRLVKLCKDKKERNNSDSVLVACLAALRKISNVRGDEELLKLGAQDLVENSLWDSFMAYSSKQESYV